MSDFNSSLPVRTQSNGDVVAFIADGTISTQLLGVDSSGRITIKLDDGSGNAINSQTLSASQWLQIVAPSNGPAAPGTAAVFSGLAGGIFNSTPPTLTNGQQASIQLNSSGQLIVQASNFPNTLDTNYGVVGANTLRTASEIGNATGAADFNFGASSAQTLRVAALLGNAAGVIDYNYGTVGAQTVRTASEIGNATGAADFNNGATGAQTLRVAANLAVAGANVSALNPVPVSISGAVAGTSVNNYNTAAAVAAGASSNHIYTITAAKTFNGKKIWGSASGKLKIEVRVSPDGATYSTLWVGFNSTATPNITIDLDQLVFLESGVGSTIEVIRTNEDKQAMDVYSTISGTEV